MVVFGLSSAATLAKMIWRIIVEISLSELHLYMYIWMKLYLVSKVIESTYPSVNLYEPFPLLQTSETLAYLFSLKNDRFLWKNNERRPRDLDTLNHR